MKSRVSLCLLTAGIVWSTSFPPKYRRTTLTLALVDEFDSTGSMSLTYRTEKALTIGDACCTREVFTDVILLGARL